jgi:hypothetical protein
VRWVDVGVTALIQAFRCACRAAALAVEALEVGTATLVASAAVFIAIVCIDA